MPLYPTVCKGFVQVAPYRLQAEIRMAAIYVGFTPSTGNVGHESPAMRVSRPMRLESAFCDFIRSTPRS